jgi:hypothetical protein
MPHLFTNFFFILLIPLLFLSLYSSGHVSTLLCSLTLNQRTGEELYYQKTSEQKALVTAIRGNCWKTDQVQYSINLHLTTHINYYCNINIFNLRQAATVDRQFNCLITSISRREIDCHPST